MLTYLLVSFLAETVVFEYSHSFERSLQKALNHVSIIWKACRGGNGGFEVCIAKCSREAFCGENQGTGSL